MEQLWRTILLFLLLSLPLAISAQNRSADIVFWNVENYYDPFPDSPQQDPAFTPQGANHWTWRRFMAKRDALAKTIIAMGTTELPVVIGLCEVESRFALEQLVRQTPLAPAEYRIVHRDGPDARGMDVALLYRPDRFRPLLTRFLTVRLPDTTHHTREILYAKGVLDLLDTLHLFVNHWPSKWGGAKTSAARRMAAATRLRASIDSIFALHPFANIIIMGDFNDTPSSKVLRALTAPPSPPPPQRALTAPPALHNPSPVQHNSSLVQHNSSPAQHNPTASPPQHNPSPVQHNSSPVQHNSIASPAQHNLSPVLHNLSAPLARRKMGTIRYRGRWELIDQFIVSENMLNAQEPISTSPEQFRIFSAPFLLIPDEKYIGTKPFRTYLGPRYQGGISDHLPVIVRIVRNY